MEFRKILPFVLIALAVVLSFPMCTSYNNSVTKDETVKKAWSNVESQYQRRADLIPNLVSTVKGYADFEKSTLEAVIQARADATKVQVKLDDLSPEKIQQFEQAQGALTSSLGRLLVAVERYPDLKANQNFLDLQTQLEGTENRINEARRQFNETVNDYNAYIRKFPTNFFMGIFGFTPKGYFQSTEGAEKAPEVKF